MYRKLATHNSSPTFPPANQCRKRSFRTGPGKPTPLRFTPAEPRLLCSDLLTLRLVTPGFAARDVCAVLEEISVHSASFQFEEPIPLGTNVNFLLTESAEGGNLTGTVEECLHHSDLGYFAEVRFVPGCTWSPIHYRPLHLFEPAALQAVARAAAGEL